MTANTMVSTLDRSPGAAHRGRLHGALAWIAPAAVVAVALCPAAGGRAEVYVEGPNYPSQHVALGGMYCPEAAYDEDGDCDGPAGDCVVPYPPCTDVAQGGGAHYSDFGFEVPVDAVVLGIEVALGAIGGLVDDVVNLQLQNASGTAVGALRTVVVPGGVGYVTAWSGAVGDKWDVDWSATDVNATMFGIQLADTDLLGGFRLEFVSISVYYAYQDPRYSVAPGGPGDCDPADVLVLPNSGYDGCGGSGTAGVLIPCAELTFAASCDAPGGGGPESGNDDVAALSFLDAAGPLELYFSVDTHATACPGTEAALQAESFQQDGDELEALLPVAPAGACGGDNNLFLSGTALGLIEVAAGPEVTNDDDELDALAWPGSIPMFTLAPSSPTLATLGATSSDVLSTPVLGDGPVIAIQHDELGLDGSDAIDALCLVAADAAQTLFSLAPGSPSLDGEDGVPGTEDDLSPGAFLVAGPAPYVQAGDLGLLDTDNADAAKCVLDELCADPDGDGICAGVDNCDEVANEDQADGDEDDVGDACDPCPADPEDDADADGICSDEDNCPEVANPDQEDGDGNGTGDACQDGPGDCNGSCATARPGPDSGIAGVLALLLLLLRRRRSSR